MATTWQRIGPDLYHAQGQHGQAVITRTIEPMLVMTWKGVRSKRVAAWVVHAGHGSEHQHATLTAAKAAAQRQLSG